MNSASTLSGDLLSLTVSTQAFVEEKMSDNRLMGLFCTIKRPTIIFKKV